MGSQTAMVSPSWPRSGRSVAKETMPPDARSAQSEPTAPIGPVKQLKSISSRGAPSGRKTTASARSIGTGQSVPVAFQ